MSRIKRPPSDDLVDLHVFVVPIELWLGKYRTAYNNVALESTSAGFIRAHPSISLYDLRGNIEEEIGFDVVPESYVFLRSVGRCMAVVNEHQEHKLRAKHFLPPVAYSPEIFVLPGTHEWLASTTAKTQDVIVRSGSEASTEVENDSYDPHEENHREANYLRESPNRSSNHVNELPAEEISNGAHQSADDSPRETARLLNRQQNFEKLNSLSPVDNYDSRNVREGERQYFNESEKYDSQELSQDRPRDSYDKSEMLRENAQPMKRQSNLSEIVKNKKQSVHRRDRSPSPGFRAEPKSTIPVHHKDRSTSPSFRSEQKLTLPGIQIIKPEMGPSVLPQGRNLSTPTPLPSARVIRSARHKDDSVDSLPGEYSTHDQQRRKDGENERVRNKRFDEGKDTDLAKSRFRSNSEEASEFSPRDKTGNVNRDNTRGRSRSDGYEDPINRRRGTGGDVNPLYRSEENGPKPHQTENDMDRGRFEDERSKAVESRSDSDLKLRRGSDENESKPKKYEPVIDKDQRDSGISEDDLNEFSTQGEKPLSRNDRYASRGKGSQRSQKDEEKRRRLEDEKRRMEEKKKNMQDDAFRMMKEMEDLLLKQKEGEEKKRKEEEERKKKAKAEAEIRKYDMENLKEELKRVREERQNVAKTREQLIKTTKDLKAKVDNRKGTERNPWKKKYLDEKRRTTVLEEELNGMKVELVNQQRKLFKLLEGKEPSYTEEKKTVSQTNTGPSELSNLKNNAHRVKGETESLTHDVAKFKRKLTVENKKRTQAELELKELRGELAEKKIKSTLTKTGTDSISPNSKQEKIKT